MASETDILVDAGVDWITCTATTKTAVLKLLEYGRKAAHEEKAQGNEWRCWNWQGYKGYKSGGVAYGARFDSAILRVSGGVAREHINGAYEASTNCSRIDLQVTVRPAEGALTRIRSNYDTARKYTDSLKRGPEVRILESSNQTATVYLGQRASPRFGRIYDKGEESKIPVLDECVRYEYEVKGELAMPTLAQLAKTSNVADILAGQVHRFFQTRHCAPSLKTAPVETTVLHRSPSDRHRSLAWIRECVGPTVRRLASGGMAQEVWDCLSMDYVAEELAAQKKRTRPELRKVG